MIFENLRDVACLLTARILYLCTALALTLPLPAAANPAMVDEAERENWLAVGRVNVGGFRSKALCSGVLIGPTEVLTAGHCVVDGKTGRAHEPYRVHFVAGWHKGDHSGASKAASIRIHPQYFQRQGFDRIPVDLAVITLQDPIDVPPAIVDLSGLPFREGRIKMLGYRSDRSHILTDYQGCSAYMFRSSMLSIDCDVTTGTSGAPVFGQRDGLWEVIGVVSSRVQNRGRDKALAALATSIKTAPVPDAEASIP